MEKGYKETYITLGVFSVDRWLWSKMGKKKSFPNRENHIIKCKAELGAGDFDSWGVLEDAE